MTEEMSKFERELYTELYHFPGSEKSLVQDKVSGQICLKKELSIYNVEVFEFLRTHECEYIAKIKSYWEENENLIVIEELISGQSLEYALQNETLSWDKKRKILLQVCEGLRYLHQANPVIIHRDLKPANIMITEDGNAKIIDYDAAKTFDEKEDKDTVLIGTQGSAAPEQYGFGKVDARTDIYAVGILIQRLFPDDPKLRKVADKATRVDRRDRYQSDKDLMKAINASFDLRKDTSDSAGYGNDGKAKRWIDRIPGIRSGNPFLIIFSNSIYILLAYLFLNLTIKDGTGNLVSAQQLWFERIGLIIVVALWIDLFGNNGGVFRSVKYVRSENIILKMLCRLAIAVFVLFIFMMLCIILFY